MEWLKGWTVQVICNTAVGPKVGSAGGSLGGTWSPVSTELSHLPGAARGVPLISSPCPPSGSTSKGCHLPLGRLPKQITCWLCVFVWLGRVLRKTLPHFTERSLLNQNNALPGVTRCAL